MYKSNYNTTLFPSCPPFLIDGNEIERLARVGVQLHLIVFIVFHFFSVTDFNVANCYLIQFCSMILFELKFIN